MRLRGFKLARLYGASAQVIAEAERLNAEWDEVRKGGAAGARRGTLTAVIDEYETHERFTRLKPRTQRDYRVWWPHLRALWGDIPVA
jgi:hypothetical protein